VVNDWNATRGGNAAGNTVVIEAEDQAQIQQMRWVQLQTCELLIIATTKNLMIYTADGAQLLHVVTAASGDDGVASFRGISSCIAGACDYLCVGVSTGAVCLIPLPDPESAAQGHFAFGDSLLSPSSELPLVEVAAGQAPQSELDRALVCSADSGGGVIVHALEADGSWLHCCNFEVATHDGSASLCTSAKIRGTLLYCSYSSGHVRLFDLESCSMCVQIGAHSRCITALEVHPNGSTFVTAAEDTLVHIWELRELHKVVHAGTIAATDALLTGVAFSGGVERTMVSASAYDVAAVMSWKLD